MSTTFCPLITPNWCWIARLKRWFGLRLGSKGVSAKAANCCWVRPRIRPSFKSKGKEGITNISNGRVSNVTPPNPSLRKKELKRRNKFYWPLIYDIVVIMSLIINVIFILRRTQSVNKTRNKSFIDACNLCPKQSTWAKQRDTNVQMRWWESSFLLCIHTTVHTTCK